MDLASRTSNILNILAYSGSIAPGKTPLHPRLLTFTNWGSSCLHFLSYPFMTSSTYHVIHLQVPRDRCDVVQGKLYDQECLGLEEEEVKGKTQLKAYFPAFLSLGVLLEELKKDCPDITRIEGATIHLSQDSLRQMAFDPFEMIPDVWIAPPPDLQKTDPIKNHHTIMIRPGMAFGTGKHETTALIAQALLDLKSRPQSLLDIGTGSGILAILAHQLKTSKIDAVEIDPDARNNALENFHLNKTETISLYQNIDEVTSKYDVILANILTPTLLHLKDKILSLLNPSGRLLLSGITDEEGKQIKEAFQHLKQINSTEKGGWLCLSYQI